MSDFIIMKKIFVLFLILFITLDSFAQSSLYQNGISKPFDYGMELFDKHFFNAAKYEFHDLVLTDRVENQKVLSVYYYALSALKSDEPNAAELVYSFLRNYPNHPKSNDAAHFLGNFFFEKKNYKEAIPAYLKVNLHRVQENQKSEVLFRTGYAYFQLKNYQNSIDYFNQVKTISGNYQADAYYYAGYINYNAANYGPAILDFKEADKSNFYNSKVPYMLSGIYYNQGLYEKIITYGEDVIAKRINLEKKEEIQLFLAEAYFEKRNFANAAINFDAFLNAKKGNLSAIQLYKAGVAQFETLNYS